MNEDDYIIDAPPPPPRKEIRTRVRPAAGGFADDDSPPSSLPPKPSKKGERPTSPREGRVRKPGKDKAAEPVPGDAAAPKKFDPAEICEKLDLWWENDGGDKFILKSGSGVWSKWPMKAVKDRIRKVMYKEHGRLIAQSVRKDSEEIISEIDDVFMHAREWRCVEEVVPGLAGYKSGLHTLSDGTQIVVRLSPKYVEAKQGEWPTIKALIEGRLDLGEGEVDQVQYFHAWCKIAYESLMFGEPGSYKPGHAMVLAGPVGCGKSRLQTNVITGLLGGRHADPTPFLLKEDNFNGDTARAEHQMMEELLTSSWSAEARAALSEAIKRMVANTSHRMRLMKTDPRIVELFWRLSISLNNDPDKLRAFPMLTPDFRDKVVMLLVAKRPLPMPTKTAAEQKLFNDKVRSELPAYAYWLLNEFKLPDKMLVDEMGEDATRFGFASYQHPSLAAQLFDDSPAAQLLSLIDAAEFESKVDGKCALWELTYPLNTSGRKQRGGEWVNIPNVWRGTAEVLEELLTGELEGYTSNVAKAAKRLLNRTGAANMLSRLAADRIDRVCKGDTSQARGWIIAAPAAQAMTPKADE